MYIVYYRSADAHSWVPLICDVIDFQRYLSSVIDELDEAWDRRKEASNALPHVFARSVSGSIDTFPIVINRPSTGNLQRLFYNGKYACHVVKVR